MKRRPKLSGFVRERGGSRQLVITVDGKQYSKAVKVRTKREAQALLPAFIAEVQSGAVAAAKDAKRKLSEAPMFRELADSYVKNYMEPGPDGAATRRAYRYAFARIGAKEISETRVLEITKDQLHRALRSLAAGGLSVATVKLVHAALSKLFGHAVETGLIATSPLPRFSKLALDRGEDASQRARRSALSDGQVAALLAASVTDNELAVWISLMVSLGLRPGEALALRWQDVDLSTRVLHVGHSAKPVAGGGHSRIGRTKTAGSVRSLRIGPELAAVLQAERDRQEQFLARLAGIPADVVPVRPLLQPPDCLLPSGWADHERTAPLPIGRLAHRFEVAAKAAGLPGVSPHWLRHTAISRLLAGTETQPGIGLAAAARLAGHSDPGTTSRVYAHALAESLDRAVAIGDALLRPRPSAPVEQLPNTARVTAGR